MLVKVVKALHRKVKRRVNHLLLRKVRPAKAAVTMVTPTAAVPWTKQKSILMGLL
jgi:hypothetical protein